MMRRLLAPAVIWSCVLTTPFVGTPAAAQGIVQRPADGEIRFPAPYGKQHGFALESAVGDSSDTVKQIISYIERELMKSALGARRGSRTQVQLRRRGWARIYPETTTDRRFPFWLKDRWYVILAVPDAVEDPAWDSEGGRRLFEFKEFLASVPATNAHPPDRPRKSGQDAPPPHLIVYLYRDGLEQAGHAPHPEGVLKWSTICSKLALKSPLFSPYCTRSSI